MSDCDDVQSWLSDEDNRMTKTSNDSLSYTDGNSGEEPRRLFPRCKSDAVERYLQSIEEAVSKMIGALLVVLGSIRHLERRKRVKLNHDVLGETHAREPSQRRRE